MLSENIKKHRKKRNYTQKDLACLSGLSQSYISELENGKYQNPSMNTVVVLAKTLNTSIRSLLKENKSA